MHLRICPLQKDKLSLNCPFNKDKYGSSLTTRAGETRALMEAGGELPRAKLHLITLQPELSKDLPKRVTTHAAANWLLSDDGA